jgi:hypothetical protein
VRIRPSAPKGVKRPFQPALTADETERHGDALDHIAHTLTAIDHNLEALVENMKLIVSHLTQKP